MVYDSHLKPVYKVRNVEVYLHDAKYEDEFEEGGPTTYPIFNCPKLLKAGIEGVCQGLKAEIHSEYEGVTLIGTGTSGATMLTAFNLSPHAKELGITTCIVRKDSEDTHRSPMMPHLNPSTRREFYFVDDHISSGATLRLTAKQVYLLSGVHLTGAIVFKDWANGHFRVEHLADEVSYMLSQVCTQSGKYFMQGKLFKLHLIQTYLAKPKNPYMSYSASTKEEKTDLPF